MSLFPTREDRIQEKAESDGRKSMSPIIEAQASTIKRICAENERLRAALQTLVERIDYYADEEKRHGLDEGEGWNYTRHSSDMDRAREALNASEPSENTKETA